MPGKRSSGTRQKIGKVVRGAQAKERATIKLTEPLRQGLTILIKSPDSKKGFKSNFRQVVAAIYIDGKRVAGAPAGQPNEPGFLAGNGDDHLAEPPDFPLEWFPSWSNEKKKKRNFKQEFHFLKPATDSGDRTGFKGKGDAGRVLAKLRGYVAVRVFYATNRKHTGSRDPNKFYGGQRSDSEDLSFGTCEVSIPEDHRIGELETASIWRLDLREDPKKHVTLLSVHEFAERDFYGELNASLSRSEKREALVFVHGFGVTFRDAARRTAQLAYDLKLDGAPILYSWPSRGKLSLAAYRHDANNIRLAAIHLERFLLSLAAQASASTVHLIAHSMGNQALTEALSALSAKLERIRQPAFREVVLTAPDIDSELFKQLARQFKGSAKRITLYASSNDKALVISKKYLGNYPRAGDSGNGIVVVPGVDSIDVSEVSTDLVGHSYYGDNDSVLSDMFYLLAEGKAPHERFGLAPRTTKNGTYWYFQPRK